MLIAEHAVLDRRYHSGDNFPKWSAAELRTYLNTATSGWLTGKSTLQGAVQSKTLYTRIQAYGTGANNYTSAPSLYETTEDKVFLLSLEEMMYTGADSTTIMNSATTDIAAIRTNGSKVIFADQNARKMTTTSGVSTDVHFRSPSPATQTNRYPYIRAASSNLAISSAATYSSSDGNRPAAWVVQQ